MRKYPRLQIGYVNQLIKAGLNNEQIKKVDKKVPTWGSIKLINLKESPQNTATKVKLLVGLNLSGDDIADILNVPHIRVTKIIENLIGD